MGRVRRRAARPAPGSEAGFTLIEVMAALLLLTVGIFAVATTFDFSRASSMYCSSQEVLCFSLAW